MKQKITDWVMKTKAFSSNLKQAVNAAGRFGCQHTTTHAISHDDFRKILI